MTPSVGEKVVCAPASVCYIISSVLYTTLLSMTVTVTLSSSGPQLKLPKCSVLWVLCGHRMLRTRCLSCPVSSAHCMRTAVLAQCFSDRAPSPRVESSGGFSLVFRKGIPKEVVAHGMATRSIFKDKSGKWSGVCATARLLHTCCLSSVPHL